MCAVQAVHSEGRRRFGAALVHQPRRTLSGQRRAGQVRVRSRVVCGLTMCVIQYCGQVSAGV
jgi:hypothetical protein